jgi:hypothetical protein
MNLLICPESEMPESFTIRVPEQNLVCTTCRPSHLQAKWQRTRERLVSLGYTVIEEHDTYLNQRLARCEKKPVDKTA